MILVTCRFFESSPHSTGEIIDTTHPASYAHPIGQKRPRAGYRNSQRGDGAHLVSRNRLAKPNQKLFSQAVQAIASIAQAGNDVGLLVQALIAGSQEDVYKRQPSS